MLWAQNPSKRRVFNQTRTGYPIQTTRRVGDSSGLQKLGGEVAISRWRQLCLKGDGVGLLRASLPWFTLVCIGWLWFALVYFGLLWFTLVYLCMVLTAGFRAFTVPLARVGLKKRFVHFYVSGVSKVML